MIRQVDMLVAVLDGVDVDSGTAGEIGFAYGLGKPVFGLRTDFRMTGDNEAAGVNLQFRYFIEQAAGPTPPRSMILSGCCANGNWREFNSALQVIPDHVACRQGRKAGSFAAFDGDLVRHHDRDHAGWPISAPQSAIPAMVAGVTPLRR